MLLSGVFAPITTPFYPDGKLYLKKLEFNVARYSRAPLAGIVVLGSTGEAILLSDDERHAVLKCAREAVAPEKVLIAGTGMESADETLRLTEYAANVGYDAAMVRTPQFYRAVVQRPENMLAFYRFVADRSLLPVLIYNFPGVTAYDMPAELVVELAEHPNIIGIKESSGAVEKVKRIVEGTRQIKRTATVTETFTALTPRMRHVSVGAIPDRVPQLRAQVLGAKVRSSDEIVSPALPHPSSSAVSVQNGIRTRQKEVGFQVLVGSAQSFYPSLLAGAVGGILAFADAAPTAGYEIYAAFKQGDLTLAEQKQQRVAAVASRVFGEMGIAGAKYACDLNGYYGGPVRLPLLPLKAEQKREVERLLADIRN